MFELKVFMFIKTFVLFLLTISDCHKSIDENQMAANFEADEDNQNLMDSMKKPGKWKIQKLRPTVERKFPISH